MLRIRKPMNPRLSTLISPIFPTFASNEIVLCHEGTSDVTIRYLFGDFTHAGLNPSQHFAVWTEPSD